MADETELGGEVVNEDGGELADLIMSGTTRTGEPSSSPDIWPEPGEDGSGMHGVECSSIVEGMEGKSCEVKDRPRFRSDEGRGTLEGSEEERAADLRAGWAVL